MHISPGVLGGTARMCLSTKSRQISSPGRRTGRGSSKSPPLGLTITVEWGGGSGGGGGIVVVRVSSHAGIPSKPHSGHSKLETLLCLGRLQVCVACRINTGGFSEVSGRILFIISQHFLDVSNLLIANIAQIFHSLISGYFQELFESVRDNVTPANSQGPGWRFLWGK